MMLVAATLGAALALQAAQVPTARLVVSPDSGTLEVDASIRLQAQLFDSTNTLVRDAEVRWFTNSDAVTIDAAGNVTAVKPGRATVTALAGGIFRQARIVVPQLPPAAIEISAPLAELRVGTATTLSAVVTTRLGGRLWDLTPEFSSSDPAVATVDAMGLVTARRQGTATITARSGAAAGSWTARVVPNEAVSYVVSPADSAVRTGDVVRFRVTGVTRSGQRVGGFTPAWSVTGSGATIAPEGEDGVFVAEEPGTYRVVAWIGDGAVESSVVTVEQRRSNGRLELVGRGPAAEHHSADMWPFQGADGRDYAYIGTYNYDWMKAWDVTDPANPVLTDSVQVDARRINDVKIHPNNRIGIITREGASGRANGIVLLDLSNPGHPTILSEYTETVSGGVHNVWIDGDNDLIYAAHNGTSDVHIIDIADPRSPREVGRWGLDKQGKTLHDVIVQDGYAYLSYWQDGLVMLDVGAGTHGGTPTQPVMVSQYIYPEPSNTHTAYRHGRYLFVGDEVFPSGWDADAPIHTRGYVHVIDYIDPENPVEVARYEVPEAGVHNFWAEGDRLYIGYYQAGFRVLDISGELRGDLYAQGRELAVLWNADEGTTVPNWPMAFGLYPFKGNLYGGDLNSGLWIVRYTAENLVP